MKTLDQIYPPATFLAPRLMEEVRQWTPGDDPSVEFRTGQLLSCAGDLAILCHRSVAAPDGLAAMADAGIPVPSNLDTYLTREDYIDLVGRLRRGERAIFVYSHPPDLFTGGHSLVDNNVLRYLNNKEFIPDLVPKSSVGDRRIVSANGAGQDQILAARLPCVVKVASDDPAGGSSDIAVCLRRRHLKRAAKRFAQADKLIIEAFIHARRNPCVQYNIRCDGAVEYIGAAEQLCTRAGAQTGNLIDPDNPPPQRIISLGRKIAEAGAAHGFRGIAGFDILEAADGQHFAIDLNFRPVSSTVHVLTHDRLAAERGRQTSRLANFIFDGPLKGLLSQCRRALEAGWFVPLTFFDPQLGGFGPGRAKARALIMADTPTAVSQRQRQLAALGLHMVGGPTGIGRRRGSKTANEKKASTLLI